MWKIVTVENAENTQETRERERAAACSSTEHSRNIWGELREVLEGLSTFCAAHSLH